MPDVVAKLIRLDKPNRPETLLNDDVTTLGRAASCQIVIDSNFASRRHAQIIRRNELYWLRDLNSKNGVILDGQPAGGETLLNNGAEIRIGEARFRFLDPQATRTHPGLSETTILQIDSDAREVWLGNEKLSPPLSVKQLDLLLCLYQRAGEAVSKDELASAVWPEAESNGVYDYQIDKMVSRVRKRIGKSLIETVWGYGYRLKRV